MTREEAIRCLSVHSSTNGSGLCTDKQHYEAKQMAIKALSQQTGDAISRQAAIEKIHWLGFDSDTAIKCDFAIRALPSVNPQPKTGHWEWEQYYYYPERGNWHCSECKCVVVECVDKNEKGGIPLYKYCPQCGAKIESEEQT